MGYLKTLAVAVAAMTLLVAAPAAAQHPSWNFIGYQDLPASGSSVVIGDAIVQVDGETIYEINRAKVGVFREIDYPDYPLPSRNSKGGRMGA